MVHLLGNYLWNHRVDDMGYNARRLSITQLEMLARCGEQYRRRYVNGEKIPPTCALIRGRAAHKGRQANMAAKLTGPGLPLEAVEATAADEVDAAFAAEPVLLHEEDGNLKKALGKTKDAAIAAVRTDYRAFQATLQPAAVEQEIVWESSQWPLSIIGIIDLVDSRNIIYDLKTSSKMPSPSAADESDQLTLYSLLYRYRCQQPESGLVLQYIVQNGRQCLPVSQTTSRDDEDYLPLLARISVSVEAIQRGVFVPATPTAWWCSPKWCGYYDTCPYKKRRKK